VNLAAHPMHLFDPEPYSPKRWPCPHCGGMPTPVPGLERMPELGADPCLGWLADVAQACCGHGNGGARDPWDRTADSRRPYVVVSPGCRPDTPPRDLPDPVVLEGAEGLAFFRSRGVGPP
jgi:hypothetical protein